MRGHHQIVERLDNVESQVRKLTIFHTLVAGLEFVILYLIVQGVPF